MTKKSDAPAIRFKGFSDAWEQRKLGDVGETYTGLSGKTKADFGHGQARFVTYMNVFSNPISNPEMTEPIEIDPKQNEVEVGDVFFTTSSETPEEVGMSSVLLEKRGKIYLNSFCFGFRPTEKIDSYYLAYMLRSESAREKIILLAQGISRYNISKNKVMEIAVSLPSLDEQKLIGQYFRQLDNLITLHQRKCVFLFGFFQAFISMIFTASTFSWEQRKFEEIAVRSSVICSDDTLPRVEYEDIVSGTGRLNKDIYAKQSIKSGIAFHQGDVLYGKLRPYLQNWLLPTFDGLAVGDFWVLQPQNADSSFLYRLIQSRQFDEVANQSTGTKMPRADWKLVSKTVFSIPSNISEQAAIGTYFTALDSLITLHQRECISFTARAGRRILTANKKRNTSSWEQRKVGDLLIERNQQAPMSDEYPLMAFIANEGVAPKGERYDRSALVTDTVNKLYKKTEKGDFIYSSNNLETGSIGLNKYGKACISPVYSIFEPTGIADSDFLGRRLVRKDFINAMVKWRQGVIYGQWRIHESDFLKIEITVPSVEEQRKIGAYLDQLDNLITLHQRKFEKLTNVKKSMLEKMFPQNGSSYPEIRFKGFTDPWEQRKLGDVVQITMGQSPDGSTYSDEPSDYILVQGNADLQNGWVCPRIWTTQITKKADAGDLIMSVRAPAGAMGKTAYNAVIGRGVAAIKGNEFIYQLLVKMDMDGFWKTLSCGSTFESLNSDNIKNAEVKVPTTAEQVQIGDFFRHLDNLITLHQRELEKLQNIKKSMLEKMFV